MRAHAEEPRLTGALGVSALLHLALAGVVVWTLRPGAPVVLPPVYTVNIVAAPPGPRAIGEVRSGPQVTTPARTPPKVRDVAPKAPPKAPAKSSMKAPPVHPTRATPNVARTSQPTAATPKAGGGPTGGNGADVATVRTEGVDFPFPGYLNNIVRQIALNFHPDDPNAPLRAEVAFLIHRDGTVTNFRFVTRSGVYAFDLQAQGAVEKAATAFGALPDGFRDDVLPVVFSFDPQFLR